MQDQEEALEAFLASVEKQAYHLALVAMGDAEEALDVVQDAMFALARKYGEKSDGEWRPLFFRILQNRIRDRHRRNRVRNCWRVWFGGGDGDGGDSDPLSRLAAPAHADPARRLEWNEAGEALMAALRQLPLRQQQTFLLRAWQGLSVAETAVAMQCSAGSVKTHYSRELRALRQMLPGYRSS